MIVISEPSQIDGLTRGSANSCRDGSCSMFGGFINEHCGIDDQGKEEEEEMKEQDPSPQTKTRVSGRFSNDVVLTWLPDVDASDEDTENDVRGLVDSSEC